VEEFINLRQGSMNVQECALIFTQLSKYAPSVVVEPRDEISRFVMGVSDLLEKECRTTCTMITLISLSLWCMHIKLTS